MFRPKCVFIFALLLLSGSAVSPSAPHESGSNIGTRVKGLRNDDQIGRTSQDFIQAHEKTGMLNLTTWFSDFVPSAMKKSILHSLCTVGLLACVACINGGTAATTPAKIPGWQATHELTKWTTDYTFQNADSRWSQGPYFGAEPWGNIRIDNR